MSAPAVIAGDFSTFRHVQGRKVLQLIIEVPAESASQVFATFGYPGSGSSIPVAIARLVEKPKDDEQKPERRHFADLPFAQQAAMRCNEPDFERFLFDRQGPGGILEMDSPGDDLIAAHVRWLCCVDSRAKIVKGTPAGDKWAALDAEFYAWSRGMR